MTSRTPFKLTAVAVVVATAIGSGPGGLARAGLVATEHVIAERAASAERARLADFLQRQDVREHMVRLGVRPDEAVARVEALSDAEVRQVTGRLDTAPAGQIHGPVIAAAALVFIVLLILDLLGVTDVFPFIDPIDKKTAR